ncbi:MAG: LLM class flavin-dependent oxidoreductase [Rhodospirillaceae bacterium]|jgi:alkanesulfonate monooxygenase SsuD/methylene tetrahydromethanopterin reductase-like flavin-dependent oxidoreductase (luciferase family)|nr:LLM class flavin-dependent oxidoreductase [Rhodospirillaceae bacterium]MBT4042067.1 LLM class flavin-dependent oxidoreductase [Rhodospirillaceae bacterium]MBT4690786.1 LLM class flavin-dependent oxidoreductase [Rhodospirillaceae bacterium]MBT5080526.1 LLM class flavin-dependent oxidoreductase [Rhodospirillaceae bacterium]MBT5526605.1 LLM class flavin-dependent oxidoreductase [Rhodospirillaceae bacterium]
MKFGGIVATKIDDWQIFPYLEDLGYDSGWVPDSQMIWSDCYATMALAAQNTSTLRLGTGVAIAGTRLAPVTAHSIASINRIAPGRVFLGIGTGHTAMRIMGQDPVPPSAFRDYLRVVRGLLAGEEVEYAPPGKESQPIKFLDRQLECIDTEHQVPIYVAANGPKALAATGAYGDGRISAGNEPYGLLTQNLERIRRGGEEVGRVIDDSFHASVLTFACIMRPGETLTSDRVIEETGAQVVSSLHFWYELYRQRGNDKFILGEVRGLWEDYKRYVETEMPEDRRHQILHTGHCAYLPEAERRFVTPEMIKASGGLVGEPDEILSRMKALEAAGLREVVLMPPIHVARSNFQEFSEQIMAKY